MTHILIIQQYKGQPRHLFAHLIFLSTTSSYCFLKQGKQYKLLRFSQRVLFENNAVCTCPWCSSVWEGRRYQTLHSARFY